MVRNIDIELKSGKKLSLSLDDVAELRECLRSLNEFHSVLEYPEVWRSDPFGQYTYTDTCWGGNKPV